MGTRAVRFDLPEICVSVGNRAIDDSPFWCPCNTDISVAVLVSRAQRMCFRLFAWCYDLKRAKDLILQCQQRFAVGTRPDCRISREVMCDLSSFVSFTRDFVNLLWTGLRRPLQNARQDQITACGNPGEIPNEAPMGLRMGLERTSFRLQGRQNPLGVKPGKGKCPVGRPCNAQGINLLGRLEGGQHSFSGAIERSSQQARPIGSVPQKCDPLAIG